MNLNGFRRPRTKRYGGLAAVSFVRITDVLSVRYDHAGEHCLAVTLKPEAAFASYDFDEEQAYYTETTVSDAGGLFKTVHELSFSIARLDSRSGEAVLDLALASRDGVAAIVTTACGDRLLVGHTPELGAAHPLRLVMAAGTTGHNSTDDTRRRLILRSESVSYARRVTINSYMSTVDCSNERSTATTKTTDL